MFSSSARRLATVGLTTAALVGGGTGFASAVSLTAQEIAPDCVHTSFETGKITKTFKATNTCNSTQRVRFIFARHSDSDCYTLSPGEWHSLQVARTTALSRLDKC